MDIIDTFSEIETASKPISEKLQQRQDFQILAEAYGHTTISINRDNNDKILMCQGNDLLLNGISFKSSIIWEEHITSLSARLSVLQGEVQYSNSQGSTGFKKDEEQPISVDEPHWVTASRASLLVLIKNQPKQLYHEN